MSQSFELYMISISWENSGSFSSYKLSEYPLKHQSYDNGIYQYDIVIYTKENSEYYQFCLKTSGIPILRSNDENNKWSFHNQLYKLENNLWIIKGDWDIGQRGKGYCKCPSINTVGKIHIGITYDRKKYWRSNHEKTRVYLIHNFSIKLVPNSTIKVSELFVEG